jgi:hypothetical protein
MFLILGLVLEEEKVADHSHQAALAAYYFYFSNTELTFLSLAQSMTVFVLAVIPE